jgi:hypothetical protein
LKDYLISYNWVEREVERGLQVMGVRRWRALVTDRTKMEGHFSTGQSPQRAVVPMEEEFDLKMEVKYTSDMTAFCNPTLRRCESISTIHFLSP